MNQEWQPIETAPISGPLWVLLGCVGYGVPEIGYFNKRLNLWCNDECQVFQHGSPTHWMPLPDPPEV